VLQTDDRRQTDRQTTDGRAIAYSEREREFTFANNVCAQVNHLCVYLATWLSTA